MIVFINGEYKEEDKAVVSVQDRAFIFGDGVYEGLRIYNKKIFKLKGHQDRLQRSLDEFKIEYLLTNELERVYHELYEKNGYTNEELFYYFQISRGAGSRVHAYSSVTTPVGMYAFLVAKPMSLENYTQGINVCTTPDIRWARCDIKCTSLVANCMANEEAQQKNCTEALFVHDGVITEGTLSNVFFVKEGEVHTHGKTNRILGGITREVVIELCKENGINVFEFPITLNKLNSMDEAFITGTTGEVTPIVNIDGKSVGNGQVGEVTKQLQKLFKEAVKKECY